MGLAQGTHFPVEGFTVMKVPCAEGKLSHSSSSHPHWFGSMTGKHVTVDGAP